MPFVLVELIDRRALNKAQRNGSAINRHFPMAAAVRTEFLPTRKLTTVSESIFTRAWLM